MSSIAFKEDIIKELSKELNIPEKEIQEIVDINISYIKKSVKEKEYVIINLPNLCKIRLNFRLALSSFHYTKKSNSIKKLEKREQLTKQIKVLKDSQKINRGLLNYKVPLFERLYRKAFRISHTKYIYSNMYKVIRDLENFTNNIIDTIK
jgi:hypothetical protein